METKNAVPAAHAVHRLVPFVQVLDVEASLTFYALLGFRGETVMRDPGGRAFWALAKSGTGEIMFATASGPVDAGQQAVLFYMYSADVAALRRQLLADGLFDGGAYRGQAGLGDGRRVVFEVQRRHYMPGGEVRVHDPDGYCILVGQVG